MSRVARDPSRLVFVGGLHRSGTTPLARAMAEHHEISGLVGTGAMEDEGQHLQDVYPKAKVYGGAGRFALEPRAHLTEDSPLVTSDAADRMWTAWEPFWSLDRRLLVEKSPPNLIMGRFLQAVFPGSALVIVMRHPVSVALATAKWRRLLSRHAQNATSVDAMVQNWVRAHEILRDDLSQLDRVVVLRYEELVADPATELARVQELLDVDEPIPHSSLRADHSSGYEQQWQEMGRSLLGRRRRASLVEKHAETVATFGYRMDDLSTVGPLPAPLRR